MKCERQIMKQWYSKKYIFNLKWVLSKHGASLVAQLVKNPPAMQEMQELRVLSLGQVDLLEEGMATHSSILVWREEPGGLQSMGSQRVGHYWVT